MIKDLDLTPFADKPAGTYSGGNKRKQWVPGDPMEDSRRMANTTQLTEAGRQVSAIQAVRTVKKEQEEESKKKARTKEEETDGFNVFRSQILIAWIVANGFVVVFVEAYVPASYFVKALATVVSLVNFYRFVGCALFVFARTLRGTVNCFCPCSM